MLTKEEELRGLEFCLLVSDLMDEILSVEGGTRAVETLLHSEAQGLLRPGFLQALADLQPELAQLHRLAEAQWSLLERMLAINQETLRLPDQGKITYDHLLEVLRREEVPDLASALPICQRELQEMVDKIQGGKKP